MVGSCGVFVCLQYETWRTECFCWYICGTEPLKPQYSDLLFEMRPCWTQRAHLIASRCLSPGRCPESPFYFSDADHESSQRCHDNFVKYRWLMSADDGRVQLSWITDTRQDEAWSSSARTSTSPSAEQSPLDFPFRWVTSYLLLIQTENGYLHHSLTLRHI